MLEEGVIRKSMLEVRAAVGKAFTVTVWSWEGEWHWKVTMAAKGNRSFLPDCWKKGHWNGCRWQRIPKEEVPGPVWDLLLKAMEEIETCSMALRVAAMQERAAKAGIPV